MRSALAIKESPTPRLLYFFFFQAEDGIRDYKVTGVQTCALPISGFGSWARLRQRARRALPERRELDDEACASPRAGLDGAAAAAAGDQIAHHREADRKSVV